MLEQEQHNALPMDDWHFEDGEGMVEAKIYLYELV